MFAISTASIGPDGSSGSSTSAANDVQIPVAAEHRADPQEGQRLPAEIDRNDPSLRCHPRRDLQREVPGARPEIDDRIPGAGIELSKDLFRALPRVPFALHDGQCIERAPGLIGDEHQRHDDEDHNEDADKAFGSHIRSPGSDGVVPIHTL